jgi:RNA polymerase sigma factor (sigma-70 family)
LDTARSTAVVFEQFVRRSRAKLLLGAAAMCGEWHAADDFVQETLVILHRRWDDIQPVARAAYARTVMAHLVGREHGSVRRERESLRDVLPEPAGSALDEGEDQVVIRLTLKDALDRLPARQRTAVYLRYWEGLSTQSIAQSLRVPAGTVRSDLTRAVKRLRADLRADFRAGCPVGDAPDADARRDLPVG